VSAGCRTLDTVVKSVADGIGSWRGGRETHQTDRETYVYGTVKLLSAYTVLENTKGSGDLPPAVFILVVGVRIFILFKLSLKKILKLRNLYKIFNSVLSWIHSIGSLSDLEASVMCKWWLLLHSID